VFLIRGGFFEVGVDGGDGEVGAHVDEGPDGGFFEGGVLGGDECCDVLRGGLMAERAEGFDEGEAGLGVGGGEGFAEGFGCGGGGDAFQGGGGVGGELFVDEAGGQGGDALVVGDFLEAVDEEGLDVGVVGGGDGVGDGFGDEVAGLFGGSAGVAGEAGEGVAGGGVVGGAGGLDLGAELLDGLGALLEELVDEGGFF
jgi:hypothetical protein